MAIYLAQPPQSQPLPWPPTQSQTNAAPNKKLISKRWWISSLVSTIVLLVVGIVLLGVRLSVAPIFFYYTPLYHFSIACISIGGFLLLVFVVLFIRWRKHRHHRQTTIIYLDATGRPYAASKVPQVPQPQQLQHYLAPPPQPEQQTGQDQNQPPQHAAASQQRHMQISRPPGVEFATRAPQPTELASPHRSRLPTAELDSQYRLDVAARPVRASLGGEMTRVP
ncbi:uncharacterized protein BJX67DRAFT_383848 [Aspergillus lucknowensis]|uniref:Defect at low temperature protein 1 n=1 Tax=Aspergillus lucknowensis TaxID=176173 RepID=A0ABR4LJ22_9EURO